MSANGRPVIGTSEAVAVLFILLTSRIYLPHFGFIVDEAMNAAWMIPLINMAVALAVVYLLVTVLTKSPDKDLIQTGEYLVGPYINLLFGIYYLLLFLVSAGLTLRQVSERVLAGFLPDTPISMVSALFLLGALVVAYLGTEAVVRTTRFLVLIITVSAVVLILFSIPMWQAHAVYPLWGSGIGGIISGAYKNLGDFSYILLLGFIFPFINAGQAWRISMWGVSATGLLMFIYVLVPILVFTYPSVRELTLPSFEIARLIQLGRFGQRLEVLFLPIWVFSNLIFIALSIYIVSSVMAGLSRLNDHRPFVLSASVLVMVIAFVPQSAPQTAEWTHSYLSNYSFLGVIMITLALKGAAWWKGRGDNDRKKY